MVKNVKFQKLFSFFMSNFSKSCNNKVHIVSIYKIVDWQLAGGGGSKTNFFNFLGCSELRVASLDFNYLIIMDDTQNETE